MDLCFKGWKVNERQNKPSKFHNPNGFTIKVSYKNDSSAKVRNICGTELFF